MPSHYGGGGRDAAGNKKIGSFKVPKKGMASKTRKGEEDFTTKKGSKDFDREIKPLARSCLNQASIEVLK